MEKLGDIFSRLAQRFLPDAMVLAFCLTFLVFAIGLFLPYGGVLAPLPMSERFMPLALTWFEGIWRPSFLTFALQMCMVLLTGFALAKAPPVMAVLRQLMSHVNSSRAAVVCVTLVSAIGCWINWGFGLIAAGILAKELRSEMARKGIPCHYSLIVAGAYVGMMTWHGGLSGSAPLKVASDGVRIVETINGQSVASQLAPIPLSRTIFSPCNIFMSITLMIGIPLMLSSLVSRRLEDVPCIPHGESKLKEREKENAVTGDDATLFLADRLNRNRVVPIIFVAIALFALYGLLRQKGGAAVDLNFVNTCFLSLGLLLHRNLEEYVAAVAEGGAAVTGIIMQFPLYSGIERVMDVAGIATAVSNGSVDVALWISHTLHIPVGVTYPIGAFASAAIVNAFVPSGGGQWIVQGPILCSAAHALKMPVEQSVMALAYGDQLTNMIQPFWAIPLMGLTGVNVRQFMGYCALLMLPAAPIFALALVLFY